MHRLDHTNTVGTFYVRSADANPRIPDAGEDYTGEGRFNVEKISLRIWISVLLAFIGIQLISPNGFNFGDKLTFGCALSFAIHIIIQDRFNKDRIINFFVIQSLVASILSLLGSLLFEDISKIVFSNEAISAILITGI